MKIERVLILLIILQTSYFLISSALSFSKILLLWTDEGVYVSMGKFLFSNGKIGYFDYIRPIGLPLILGFFWSQGIDPIFMGKIISWISWIFLGVSSFFISRKLGSSGYFSLFSIFFFSFFSSIFTRVLTDSISAFLASLSIYFYLSKSKAKRAISGILIGVSSMIRLTYLIFVVLLPLSELIYFFIRKEVDRKWIYRNSIFLFSFIISFLPVLLVSYAMYGDPLAIIINSFLHIRRVVWYRTVSYVELLMTFILSPFIFSFIPLLNGIPKKREVFLIFLMSLLLFLIFFSSPVLTKEKRYLILLFPTFLPLSDLGFRFIIKKSKKPFIILFLLILLTLYVDYKHLVFLINFKEQESLIQAQAHVLKELRIIRPKKILSNDLLLSALYDVREIFFGEWEFANSTYHFHKPFDAIIISDCLIPCPPHDKKCVENFYFDQFQREIEKEYTLRTKFEYKLNERRCQYLIYARYI